MLSIALTTIFRQVLSCRRHIIQEISRCELSGGGRVLISNDKIIYITVLFIDRIRTFNSAGYNFYVVSYREYVKLEKG